MRRTSKRASEVELYRRLDDDSYDSWEEWEDEWDNDDWEDAFGSEWREGVLCSAQSDKNVFNKTVKYAVGS